METDYVPITKYIKLSHSLISKLNTTSREIASRQYRPRARGLARHGNVAVVLPCRAANGNNASQQLVGYILSSKSVMETKASVISLINEVRKRQCLWNKKDEYYKNRVYVDKVWDEVAMDLDKTSKYVNVTFQIVFIMQTQFQ